MIGNINFRLLRAGHATSLIGDHFTMITMPWLVLLITGDAAALGLVPISHALSGFALKISIEYLFVG